MSMLLVSHLGTISTVDALVIATFVVADTAMITVAVISVLDTLFEF